MMETGRFERVTIHPDWRQFIIEELPTMILAVVMLILGGLDQMEMKSIFFCIGLALVFVAYYRYVYLRGTEYTITDEQLVYEHGVFSRSRDYIELYRIVDYDEKRTFLQMLMGLKTIWIHSGDRTSPKVRILGVPDNRDIVHILRERVAYNRSRMNIHEFANYT